MTNKMTREQWARFGAWCDAPENRKGPLRLKDMLKAVGIEGVGTKGTSDAAKCVREHRWENGARHNMSNGDWYPDEEIEQLLGERRVLEEWAEKNSDTLAPVLTGDVVASLELRPTALMGRYISPMLKRHGIRVESFGAYEEGNPNDYLVGESWIHEYENSVKELLGDGPVVPFEVLSPFAKEKGIKWLSTDIACSREAKRQRLVETRRNSGIYAKQEVVDKALRDMVWCVSTLNRGRKYPLKEINSMEPFLRYKEVTGLVKNGGGLSKVLKEHYWFPAKSGGYWYFDEDRMTEDAFQRQVKEECESREGVRYIDGRGIAKHWLGFPDGIIEVDGKGVFFLELKTDVGKRSEGQKRLHQLFGLSKIVVGTVRSIEEAKELLDEWTQ